MLLDFGRTTCKSTNSLRCYMLRNEIHYSKITNPGGSEVSFCLFFPNVDGSWLSVKRDFILGPLSLGGYFGTANLPYDYLNITWYCFLSLRLAVLVTFHLRPVYFHSYFLFCLLLLSVFTATILFSQSCNCLTLQASYPCSTLPCKINLSEQIR